VRGRGANGRVPWGLYGWRSKRKYPVCDHLRGIRADALVLAIAQSWSIGPPLSRAPVAVPLTLEETSFRDAIRASAVSPSDWPELIYLGLAPISPVLETNSGGVVPWADRDASVDRHDARVVARGRVPARLDSDRRPARDDANSSAMLSLDSVPDRSMARSSELSSFVLHGAA
jgi:hypothetical protein